MNHNQTIKLIEKYYKTITYNAKKSCDILKNYFWYDDLVQDGIILLFKIDEKIGSDTPGFTSYFQRSLINQNSQFIRKQKLSKQIERIYTEQCNRPETNLNIDIQNICENGLVCDYTKIFLENCINPPKRLKIGKKGLGFAVAKHLGMEKYIDNIKKDIRENGIF